MGIYRSPIRNGQHALPHGRSVDTGRALICTHHKKKPARYSDWLIFYWLLAVVALGSLALRILRIGFHDCVLYQYTKPLRFFGRDLG